MCIRDSRLSGQCRPRPVRRSAEQLPLRQAQRRHLLHLFARRQDLQLLGALHGRQFDVEPVPLHARSVASRAQPAVEPAARRCGERARAERPDDLRRIVHPVSYTHLIITNLERWFNVPIGTDASVDRTIRLSFHVRHESLEETLQVISLITGLQYTLDSESATFHTARTTR